MHLTACLRALFHPRGGTMPTPRPLAPDEERVVLSPGWNGPTLETSANYQGRGLRAYLRAPEQRDKDGSAS